MRLRLRPFLLALGLASLAPSAAEAFCGFYVGGADAKLFNNATVVALMREGTRTVLSMQNNYQGPPEGFAMVVPVPVVLQKENVKTLPRELFDKLDQLASPRLVEYWEQDPCNPSPVVERKGLVIVSSSEISLGVRVEARFSVGEYDVVILSANDSVGLDKWLRLQKYKIPDGAEPYLRPYVQGGMKFFVAKVDPAKVKFQNGSAMLSPLRFHYDAESFNLPVRLGLVNSAGTQDLLVHIIAKGQRFEVANYPNVTIPTNIDVAEDVKGSFGAFYAALFDRTLEKNPGAVVTEYAWNVSKCDPCPGPVGMGLSGDELMTLGADVLPSTAGMFRPMAMYGQADVQPESSSAGVRQSLSGELSPKLSECYKKAFEATPSLEANVLLSFTVSPSGKASGVSVQGSPLDPKLQRCVTSAVNQVAWPKREPAGGDVNIKIPVNFIRTSSFRGNDYVLTRLHARYGKDALGEDLVFRAAPPILGGLELRDSSGKLDQRAIPGPVNQFQGRYAIRRPWTEPVSCASPVRGTWGGPPGTGRIEVKAAEDIAFAPRGGLNLVSLVKQDVPDLGIAIPVGGAAPAEVPAFAEPDPEAKPVVKPVATVAPPPAPPPAGGCAACAVGSGGDERASKGAAVAAISAFAAGLFGVLRRRGRRR